MQYYFLDMDNISKFNHMIQMCSGVTGGRVRNGELYSQIFTEVNLSAFAKLKQKEIN